MAEKSLGNPAVVGLAGFGGTTLLLQFANLGLCSTGVVMWTGMFFGGLMQLIAGFKEFQLGNNFGFVAFSSYGTFWMALGAIQFCQVNKILPITASDVGWFLVMWTVFTLVMLVVAVRESWAHGFLFFTLLIGFILLDISHLVPGLEFVTKIAAIDLIVCALTAWYIMAYIVFAQVNVKLSLGRAWMK